MLSGLGRFDELVIASISRLLTKPRLNKVAHWAECFKSKLFGSKLFHAASLMQAL